MNYLGIDYGTKRVGLALATAPGFFAYPYSTLGNTPKLVERIVNICRDEKVEEIVLGWSLDYKRRENPLMKQANIFRVTLEAATGLPIHLEDEVLTTREARRDIGPDDLTDARAAAIILRTYLARRNKHN